MRLTISKSQQPGPPQATFTVRVGPFTTNPTENALWQRYGALSLDLLLEPYGGVKAVQTGAGITVPFNDALQAQEFIKKLHDACKITEAYWKIADDFHGSDDYPPAP